MNIVRYNHNNASEIIPNTISIYVENVLQNLNPALHENTTQLRNHILENLSKDGWSDKIRISSDVNITVTSVLKEIGLCLQTGNMSRFYADFLKLQTLFRSSKIKAGIYILPTKAESKIIGSNVVHLDRVVDELKVFSLTVTIPLLVYGFERSL